jgi:CheY-like chemotaxis protein
MNYAGRAPGRCVPIDFRGASGWLNRGEGGEVRAQSHHAQETSEQIVPGQSRTRVPSSTVAHATCTAGMRAQTAHAFLVGALIGGKIHALCRYSGSYAAISVPRTATRARFVLGGGHSKVRDRGAGVDCVLTESAAPHSILIVDDEPDSLETLRLLLIEEGYDTRVASSAAQALELIAQRRPDLLIADCMMPDMTGFDLCRILRSKNETRAIPILAYSGLTLPRHSDSDLYDWAVQKPRLEELLELIRLFRPAG